MRTSSWASRTSSSRSTRRSTSSKRSPNSVPACLARGSRTLTDDALRPVVFEPLLNRVEKAQSSPSVQDAVVEGDLKVHHTADGYSIVHDHRTLGHGLGGEYRGLGVVDDRDGDHAPQCAWVVHREGASGDVVGRELTISSALHYVVYLAGKPEDCQRVGVEDDRHDQGILKIDRDPDIYALAQDDTVPVPHGVQDRMQSEALDDRFDDERQVGEPDALALCKLVL